MTDFSRDPINNAIQNGIKEDINCCFEHDRYRAGLQLIYSGIDSMAFLDMPASQTEVRSTDFIHWAEKYIRFPCKEQLTGADLYGARCGLLHSYGVESRLNKKGRCRRVGYCDHSVPEVSFNPSVDPDVVIVSSKALKKVFFRGIDQFLIAAFSDPAKANIANQRLEQFILMLPYDAPLKKTT